ncbi:hypothetical protein [Marinobacter sp.]|uniref:hypothetical protein n=1 Tax=Marinobacter sp. TaxID=50741 RepID=UPI0019B556EF|nr:hypothetical protein [Marinobacter sp.]MBC7191785.1 hypothetical protein [Marinobacter sp.]
MKKLVINVFAVIAIAGIGYFFGLKHEENKTALSSGFLKTSQEDQGRLILHVDEDMKIQSLLNSKTWGKTSFTETKLELNYRSEVKPDSLIVERNTPNGIKFLVRFSNANVNLPLEFDKSFDGFNQWGELEEGYYVQVAEYDFDNDEKPEIIIAIGNGLTDLVVNIIEYHAPQLPKDAERTANWTLIGSFRGQGKAFVEGASIQLPFGGQGRYTEHTWVKNKFVETN